MADGRYLSEPTAARLMRKLDESERTDRPNRPPSVQRSSVLKVTGSTMDGYTAVFQWWNGTDWLQPSEGVVLLRAAGSGSLTVGERYPAVCAGGLESGQSVWFTHPEPQESLFNICLVTAPVGDPPVSVVVGGRATYLAPDGTTSCEDMPTCPEEGCPDLWWCDEEGDPFSASVGGRPAGATAGPWRTEAEVVCPPVPPVPWECCTNTEQLPGILYVNFTNKTGGTLDADLPNSVALVPGGTGSDEPCVAEPGTPLFVIYYGAVFTYKTQSIKVCLTLLCNSSGVSIILKFNIPLADEYVFTSAHPSLVSLWTRSEDCPFLIVPNLPMSTTNWTLYRLLGGEVMGTTDIVISS